MLGTVTLQVDSIIAWLMAGAAGFALGFIIKKVDQRRRRQIEEKRDADKKAHEERQLQQTRDHQMNHAAEVRNWLTDQLKDYHEFGIRVRYFTQKDGSSSIEVEDVGSTGPCISILQLNYDFVKYATPYQGHIHYGAYGMEMLFWVGDHAPFNGLDRLVLKEVEEYVERLRESRRNASVAVGSM